MSAGNVMSCESTIGTRHVVYHVAPDAIVILDVFSKKTQATPVQILETCRKRLAAYMRAMAEEENGYE
jgi:phage-related protein